MSLSIALRPWASVSVCQRSKNLEVAFCGSVFHDDFEPDDEVHVLVPFRREVRRGLTEWLGMEQESVGILRHDVGLICRQAVQRRENLIRRMATQESAQVVQAAC